MSRLAKISDAARDVAHYDPEEGLKTIAVAEAAQGHFARGVKNKDPLARAQFLKAIATKIKAQAQYVVWRDVKLARQGETRESISVLKSTLPATDPGDVKAHRWRKRLCIKTEDDATELNESGIIATIEMEQRFGLNRIEMDKTVRGTEGTGENEWFTPPEYIRLARAVLGDIDLDPATSDAAQRIINAAHYFTKADDGLAQEWHGRVWLNPPYAQPFIAQFASKMAAECRAGRVEAAIMLTHNYTDTAWFHELVGECSAICFTRGRVKFYSGDEVAAPTQGQAFFYFGSEARVFAETFTAIGFVAAPVSELQ